MANDWEAEVKRLVIQENESFKAEELARQKDMAERLKALDEIRGRALEILVIAEKVAPSRLSFNEPTTGMSKTHAYVLTWRGSPPKRELRVGIAHDKGTLEWGVKVGTQPLRGEADIDPRHFDPETLKQAVRDLIDRKHWT
jgi:hypothetical protein